jgi:hypothetical protein
VVNAKKLSMLVIAGPLAFAACGGDNLTLPSEGQPAHIEVISESLQGRVNSQLEQPLIVRVTDTQGRPVQGAAVEFVLDEDAGGGSVTPTGTTDADGQASSSVTLGTRVGQMIGHAQVPVDQGTTPVTTDFTVTVLSADANVIALFAGDGQSGPVGTALALPLVVQVTDAFDNPISNITIQWTAEGGGSVSAPSSVTGTDGTASIQRTLGPNAGTQTTLASADDLAGSPSVTFTSTATAGSASRVEIVSGNGQEAPAGSQLPQDFVVRLLDAGNNPIVNRPVSWVVGAGGGTMNPETSNTNSQGEASARLTLGSAPGPNTVNAVVSGLTPATFSATGTGSGSPSNLAVTTQPPTSVTAGATLNPAPVVQIRDAAGHDLPVAGVEIVVGLTSGSGQIEGTRTETTDANGQAQFNDLRITGASGSRRLIFAAEGYRSATSDKFDVNKAGTTTNITGVSPEPSNPGEAVTVNFSVTSNAGTPTGNVEVTASGGGETCTAAVSAGSCQIPNMTNPGDRTLTATYRGDATFEGSAGTAVHHVNEPVNSPPVAVADAYSTPSGQTLSVAAPGVLANDSDPEGSPLTAQLVDQATQGLVSLNSDGSFTYFPGFAASGTQDTFTYDASDGTLTSRQTVTITIQ